MTILTGLVTSVVGGEIVDVNEDTGLILQMMSDGCLLGLTKVDLRRCMHQGRKRGDRGYRYHR